MTRGRARPIKPEQPPAFRESLSRLKISHPIAHASYLLNLASPDAALWKKSVDALQVELRRAELLGLEALVVHPGAATSGSETAGLKRIARAINRVHRSWRGGDPSVRLLLENTAGQGTSLGWKFEQLEAILQQVDRPAALGVCIDTCHLFAAGYPLKTRTEYDDTMAQLEQTVGTATVHAIHVNDSKRPLGSRLDRHEHIGRGEMGMDPFRHLMRDIQWQDVPMYLETPQGRRDDGTPWDRVNLRRLRRLANSGR